MPSCPSCGKGVTSSATSCGTCGAELQPASPAAAAPAAHSYDLAPEEPKKKAEKEAEVSGGSPFDVPITPEAAAAKPGEIIRPKISLRPDDTPQQPFELTKGTLVIGVLVVLALIFMVIKACKTEYKLEGRWRQPTLSDNAFGANRPKVENFVVKGGATYEFEVHALDGDLLIGVIRRDPKASATNAALKTAPEGLTAVPKGQSRKLEGELKPGTYSWVVVNEGAKPVKGKWKYLAALPK
jgi:hypothetical protein